MVWWLVVWWRGGGEFGGVSGGADLGELMMSE